MTWLDHATDCATAELQNAGAQDLLRPCRLVLPGPERTFTVEQWGPNDFTVRTGDRYEAHLCYDEALGIVARLIICRDGGPRLRTAQEHQWIYGFPR